MKLFFALLLLSSSTFAAFSDVEGDHPNKAAIDYVQSQGIVQGYEDGTFRPENSINRAELTKIIMSATQEASEIQACDLSDINLSDIAANTWFAPYVCMAKDEGIIGGYPDGTFRPANNVLFSEGAKIIGSSFRSSLSNGSDVWFRPYIEYLATKNSIPITITRFDAELTRGEMAEIIYRLKTETTTLNSMEYQVNGLVAKGSNQAAQSSVTSEVETPIPTEPFEKIPADQLPPELSNEAPPSIPGEYVDYSSTDFLSYRGEQPVVLFFYANWCPSCQKLDQEIKSRISELPTGSRIYKTNYDAETKLRAQYGVNYQHTAVYFDAQGDVVKVQPGFGFEDILGFFN